MLSRRSVIIIDLFLVLFNLGVSSFHASHIYGGDLRIGTFVGIFLSAFVGILMILLTVWYLRECKRQDREMASLLMGLVDLHNREGGGA